MLCDQPVDRSCDVCTVSKSARLVGGCSGGPFCCSPGVSPDRFQACFNFQVGGCPVAAVLQTAATLSRTHRMPMYEENRDQVSSWKSLSMMRSRIWAVRLYFYFWRISHLLINSWRGPAPAAALTTTAHGSLAAPPFQVRPERDCLSKWSSAFASLSVQHAYISRFTFILPGDDLSIGTDYLARPNDSISMEVLKAAHVALELKDQFSLVE